MPDAAVELRLDAIQGLFATMISGKLIEQRKNDGLFYSTILAAAPDEYSQPVPFEVRSREQLGTRGEVVRIACKVGGFFRRAYEHTDKRTGEVRTVRPIVLTLDALDS